MRIVSTPMEPLPMLYEMAAGGRLLDLGVGTGRLAIPRNTRGADVHGIDASHAMLDRLHRDQIGATIPTVIGDFAEVPVEDTFDVIVCAVSTLFMLPDRERQIHCRQRAREHLTENGVVVVEAFVPGPTRYDRGQRVEVRSIEIDGVHLVLTHHAPVELRHDVAHLLMNGSGSTFDPYGFVTPCRRNSISWHDLSDCVWTSATADGRATPSAQQASSMSRSTDRTNPQRAARRPPLRRARRGQRRSRRPGFVRAPHDPAPAFPGQISASSRTQHRELVV